MERTVTQIQTSIAYLLPVSVEKLKTETEEIKAKYEKLEDSFVEQLAQKQKETMKAVLECCKSQGIKVEWEESGEEP